MKIIDTHMHFSDTISFKDTARLYSMADYSYDGYVNESAACGIVKSICMGLTETKEDEFPSHTAETPMMADLDARMPDNMYICPGINPHMLDERHLTELENAIKHNKNVVGIKIYAGYYHFDVYDAVYAPVYRLAIENGLPVVVHTGDTFSEKGLLSYSHPLNIDKLAVSYRDMTIVACHLGDPWIMDACEVAYKNKNVSLDISGLLVGGPEAIRAVEQKRLIMDHYMQGVMFLNNYKKILFGTDWPLAPMGAYVDFCKKLVPEHTYEDVFYNNACRVFSRITSE